MPPKKGGIRKRLGYDADKASGTKGVDDAMRGLFKKGRFSAKEVQNTSAVIVDAMSAGSRSRPASSSIANIADFATAGGEGAREGNLSRDIITKMGKKSNYPQVYNSPCTFWDQDSNSTIEGDMSFLLLHHHLLSRCSPQHFERLGRLSLLRILPATNRLSLFIPILHTSSYEEGFVGQGGT